MLIVNDSESKVDDNQIWYNLNFNIHKRDLGPYVCTKHIDRGHPSSPAVTLIIMCHKIYKSPINDLFLKIHLMQLYSLFIIIDSSRIEFLEFLVPWVEEFDFCQMQSTFCKNRWIQSRKYKCFLQLRSKELSPLTLISFRRPRHTRKLRN